MPRKSWLTLYEAPVPSQRVIRCAGEQIIVVGRWFFYVRSKTNPDEWHAVDLETVDGEVGHCTCRSGETRKECRHERAVRELCCLPTSA